MSVKQRRLQNLIGLKNGTSSESAKARYQNQLNRVINEIINQRVRA